MAHGQRLRRHAAHRQADEVHRLAAGLAPDELGRVLRQRLDGQRAGHHLGGAVVAVVVAQHGVGARQLRGHAVPHVQVAAQRMAEHDERAVALADDIQAGHGAGSFVGWGEGCGCCRRGSQKNAMAISTQPAKSIGTTIGQAPCE